MQIASVKFEIMWNIFSVYLFVNIIDTPMKINIIKPLFSRHNVTRTESFIISEKLSYVKQFKKVTLHSIVRQQLAETVPVKDLSKFYKWVRKEMT